MEDRKLCGGGNVKHGIKVVRFDGEEVWFCTVSDFSWPITSLTCVINTAIFRDESDSLFVGKDELSSETFPFSSFPSEWELVVEMGGVR